MEQRTGYVYMITSPTGRIYVGSTTNIEKRWNSYKKYKCKSQPKIYNSLIKHRAENHAFEIVWKGDISEMLKYETLTGWGFNVLELYNLNLTLPKLGDVYSCVSEETKTKIGKAHKGKILSKETRNKIKKSKENVSNETRLKMSKSARGKIVTDETKENMKAGQIGKKHSLETKTKMSLWQIGKIHSEITKKKISEKHKGKKFSQERICKAAKGHMKPIFQYTIENIFIKEWESAKTAEEKLNIDSSSILKCCKQQLKTSGKFIWKYKN